MHCVPVLVTPKTATYIAIMKDLIASLKDKPDPDCQKFCEHTFRRMEINFMWYNL